MTVIETHPLEPFLPADAKVLMLGSFPPPQTRWKMQFYYPNYQNDMWRIFGSCFFNDALHFIDCQHKGFLEQNIRTFLTQHGIAIFDTAYQVQRLQQNASDKFLQVVTATDLHQLLHQLPKCQHVMTTGDKATQMVLEQAGESMLKMKMGEVRSICLAERSLNLYRLPSSSRAYPLALQKKAQIYRTAFHQMRLL